MALEEMVRGVVEFVREHQVWAAPIVGALAFGESLAFVSLVIPAYHEAQRLEASFAALQAYLSRVEWTHEVIVVVEKSSDGTLELARRLAEGQAAFRIIGNPEQRGKGFAVRTGMLAARGEIRFFMDADLSTPLEEIDHFLAAFAREPEVQILIGSRQHPQTVRRPCAPDDDGRVVVPAAVHLYEIRHRGG